ncbi:hypothetical protein J6590_054135 [Homalodisca vitripennis]|nr:hypothetical protein J6590_054135 [Homalodisca vitripennis]
MELNSKGIANIIPQYRRDRRCSEEGSPDKESFDVRGIAGTWLWRQCLGLTTWLFWDWTSRTRTGAGTKGVSQGVIKVFHDHTLLYV